VRNVRVETHTSDSTNQNGDIESDLVGSEKAKIQFPLCVGDSNPLSNTNEWHFLASL
jgi:hypothetical protein